MGKKIRLFIQGVSRKQILWGITGCACLLMGLVFYFISESMIASLDTQHMAERWSEEGDVSQVSCFFSREAGIAENSLITFGHNLDQDLEQASIVSASQNPNARLWVSAYSATGRVVISNERATVDVAAVGIGGDFFLFHPLKLVSGSYFSGNDVLTDYVVIDEDAAWQLFGSNDVAGQLVEIGGVPHVITGVVERQSGRIAEAAGLTSSVAYVSYTSLSRYGTNYGINTYEVVMPNPVSGYAKNYVMEHIGVSSNEVEIVENSTRYSFLNRLKLLLETGTRSMSSKAIIYPYWENEARGYEDILVILEVFMLAAFFVPVLLLLIVLIKAWKHKTWTVKSVWNGLIDKWERFLEKIRARKKKPRKEKQQKEKQKKEKQKKEKTAK